MIEPTADVRHPELTPAARLAGAARLAALAAVALTLVMALTHWVAPLHGVTRTFYRSGEFAPEGAVEEHATEIGLSFLAQEDPSTRRNFAVQWRGFWYRPDSGPVELHVATGDEAELWVDARPVLRRAPRDDGPPARALLTLPQGVHEIVVRYRPYGRTTDLALQWSLPGGKPVALPSTSLFVDRVTPRDLMVAAAVPWLARVAIAAWLVVVALALAAWLARLRRGRLSVASPRTVARRFGAAAVPALVAPIVLFIVGPHTMHAGNPDEFVVPFRALAWPWVLGAVAAGWAVLVAAGLGFYLVSERLSRVWAAVLLALGLLLWAQGTFLVPDFGPLFGEHLDLSVHDWRWPYEALLWGGVLAAAVVFAGRIARVATLVSVAFVGMQLAGVVVSAAPGSARDRSNEGWSEPPPGLYSLSPAKNVVHIVLDAFLSEVFTDAARDDPAYFDRSFPGFVHFADHLGAFPTTKASMPAMLSGAVYRNDEPFEAFLARTVLRRSVATVLAEHGYQVRSITFHSREHAAVPGGAPRAVRYTVPTPYSSHADYLRFTSLQLFDLSSFRAVPQLLKRFVYNDDTWLLQRVYAGDSLQGQRGRLARPASHAAFLAEMAERLTADATAPVYQFVHVALPHPPLVLDAGCGVVERRQIGRSGYAAQGRCALHLVGRLFDRMRAIGVYDNSAIVLTADHGWRLPRRGHSLAGVRTPAGDLQSVALTAMPLLAIKPPGATGPLRVSTAPTAIADIPATIGDLAGVPPGTLPGEPALRLDPDARRPRSFAFHTWDNADWRRPYMDALHVFSVEGPIHDPGSWRFDRTIPEPSGEQAER